MKKKKYPEDLMMEDLLETIQHRINELKAELKLLDEQCDKRFFVPYPTIASRLRCQRDLLDLEYEQGRLRREQERRGREERERRVHEAREHFSNGGTVLEWFDRFERKWEDRKNAADPTRAVAG